MLRARTLSGFALLAAACGPPARSDPTFWEPAHDLGGIPLGAGGVGAGGAGGGDAATIPAPSAGGTPASGGAPALTGSGGATATSADCALTFGATTISAHGRYSPRNVGAIWIETADGRFVKTLRTWGGPVRLPNATAWRIASGQNVVDAVTGATRAGHGPIDATWNCTDTSHRLVPAGAYRLSITFAEDDAVAAVPPPLHVATVPFDIGPGPSHVPGTDGTNFTAMTIDLN